MEETTLDQVRLLSVILHLHWLAANTPGLECSVCRYQVFESGLPEHNACAWSGYLYSFLDGTSQLTIACPSPCRKLWRTAAKQCLQFLDDSFSGAFGISLSPRLFCIQWVELPQLCNGRISWSSQASILFRGWHWFGKRPFIAQVHSTQCWKNSFHL